MFSIQKISWIFLILISCLLTYSHSYYSEFANILLMSMSLVILGVENKTIQFYLAVIALFAAGILCINFSSIDTFIIISALFALIYQAINRKKNFSFSLLSLCLLLSLLISSSVFEFVPVSIAGIKMEWIILLISLLASAPGAAMTIFPLGCLIMTQLMHDELSLKSQELLFVSLIWIIVELTRASTKRIAIATSFLAVILAPGNPWATIAVIALHLPKNEYIKNEYIYRLSMMMSFLSVLTISANPAVIGTLFIVMIFGFSKHVRPKQHIGDVC